MVHSFVELDGMHDQAVVIDRDQRVWQKDISYGSPWFTPGDTMGYPVDEIALPARLLDDGL